MSGLLRRAALGLLAGAALLLAGCASPQLAPQKEEVSASVWHGRMALQVEDQPSQSFSAGFELRGRAEQGELTLYNPLGGTLAALQWAPGSATLRSGNEVKQFDSIDALVAGATGTAIPVASLFDWLAGSNTPVTGWEADLSQLPQGRLRARRVAPPPAADLRVALDK
ncbi:lipoprotein insertase outer membrane protein LolB [Caenimonas terrae]|uniref:Outer-membrane lipoprotein LolB n=1 Tax=Caenimonas terrae TaxID=696074 RepID=A0ABW0N809_9BURK